MAERKVSAAKSSQCCCAWEASIVSTTATPWLSPRGLPFILRLRLLFLTFCSSTNLFRAVWSATCVGSAGDGFMDAWWRVIGATSKRCSFLFVFFSDVRWLRLDVKLLFRSRLSLRACLFFFLFIYLLEERLWKASQKWSRHTPRKEPTWTGCQLRRNLTLRVSSSINVY